MSDNLYDEVITAAEPQAIDETLSVELGHKHEDALLRAKPFQGEDCHTCQYYLDTDKDISYCWHPQLRMLVGAEWWCQWWEPRTT
jgi:hypothetical protein